MSYLGKVWRGEEKLAVTFWVWLVAVQVVLLFGKRYVTPMPIKITDITPLSWLLIILQILPGIWAGIGAWRSGARSGAAARILSRIVIVVLFAFFALGTVGILFMATGGGRYVEQAAQFNQQCAEAFDTKIRAEDGDPAAHADEKVAYVRQCAAQKLKDSMTQGLGGEAH